MALTVNYNTVVLINGGTPSSQITPTSGADYICLMISHFDATDPSAVTLGGNALTKIGSASNYQAAGWGRVSAWYLASPGGSALTLAVTGASNAVVGPFSVSGGAGVPTSISTDGHSTLTAISLSGSCAVGDAIIVGCGTKRGYASNGTWNNSYSTNYDTFPTDHSERGSAGFKIATATTETSSTTPASGGATFGAAGIMVAFGGSAASASIVFNSSLSQRETSITLQTYGTSSTG